MTFVDSGYTTPETIARRAKIAEALMGDAFKPQQIEHPAQGFAQMARALLGGYGLHQVEKQQASSDQARAKALASILSSQGAGGALGTPPAAPAAPSPAPPPGSPASVVADRFGGMQPPSTDNIGRAGTAIASIESAGQANPYGAVGPMTRTGDRAHGKYQVMGANVGPWTREVLGTEMTPEQFRADPQAQEAVFKAKFGQYVKQYGNEQDAASAWFTGKPLAQGANRADVNGMTGQRYVDKFTAAFGGGGGAGGPMPLQAPSGAGAAPAPAAPMALGPQASAGAPTPLPPVTATSRAADPRMARIIEMLSSRNPAERQVAQTLANAMITSQISKDDTPTVLSPGQVAVNRRGETIAKGAEEPLKPDQREAITKADDIVMAGRNAIESLKRAQVVNQQAFSGAGAGAAQWTARNLPIVMSEKGRQRGVATTELENLVSSQALEQLKLTFGGNPTEGERKILLDLQAGISKSPQERAILLQRAQALAERRVAYNQRVAADMRTGAYYKPGYKLPTYADEPDVKTWAVAGPAVGGGGSASDPLGLRK